MNQKRVQPQGTVPPVPKWLMGLLIGLGVVTVLLMVSILVVLLRAPDTDSQEPTPDTTTTTTMATTTMSPTTATVETTAPTTIATSIVVVEVPASSGFRSYTTYLDGASVIRSGPGYEYGYVGTVGQSTQYTIVAEQYGDGVLWGKLKSGLGWVVLSEQSYTPPAYNDYSVNVNYTTYLSGDAGIYSGPGYAYSLVGTVGQSTKYTIVEEYHSGSSCWGRLKSGLGWVLLY